MWTGPWWKEESECQVSQGGNSVIYGTQRMKEKEDS